MTMLVLGLLAFCGIHLVPVAPGMRGALLRSLGEKAYKGMFSLVSALGLVLIVIGYARAPAGTRLFDPFPGAIAIAPFAMIVSFILLAAANMRTHIRQTFRHPMLIGIGIWATVHLLANGDAKGSLLFGAFLAYAIVDILSASSRHAVKRFVPVGRQDVIAIISGAVLAVLLMLFHGELFGVKAVTWGL